MNGLAINPAQHGGYVVWSGDSEMGRLRQMLFAGSLTDALEYVRKTLAKQAEQAAATPEGRLAT